MCEYAFSCADNSVYVRAYGRAGTREHVLSVCTFVGVSVSICFHGQSC